MISNKCSNLSLTERQALVHTGKAVLLYGKSDRDGSSHQHHPTKRVTMPVRITSNGEAAESGSEGSVAHSIDLDPQTSHKPMIAWLNAFVANSWSQGLVYTRHAIYLELYAQFGPGSDGQKSGASQDFSDQFFSGKDAKSRLCVWLKRALEHTPFRMRKEVYNERIQRGEVASIWHLFDLAGQSPRCDMIRFRRHLQELSEIGCYSALLTNNEPVALDVNFLVN